MRGRSRKNTNPLNKSYESNGPDVKIRGTALHIAEKYQQLARDAQASSDRIMAENYLQHAEHYLRLIAAAQPQQQPNQPMQNGQADHDSMNGRDFDDDEPKANGSDHVMPQDAPQPFVESMHGSSTVNGAPDTASDQGDDDTSDDEDGGNRPKRRTRGTRGRGSRRTTARGGDGDDGAPQTEASAEAGDA